MGESNRVWNQKSNTKMPLNTKTRSHKLSESSKIKQLIFDKDKWNVQISSVEI